MGVTVTLSDLLKSATGQREPIDVPSGTPVDCLREVVNRVPALGKWIYNDEDELKPHVWLVVNDERIYEEEYDEHLKAGDRLHIIIAVLGG
ncbi:MAG: MoaD/ThiS family protein [Dehalococcoidia bacterium]